MHIFSNTAYVEIIFAQLDTESLFTVASQAVDYRTHYCALNALFTRRGKTACEYQEKLLKSWLRHAVEYPAERLSFIKYPADRTKWITRVHQCGQDAAGSFSHKFYCAAFINLYNEGGRARIEKLTQAAMGLMIEQEEYVRYSQFLHLLTPLCTKNQYKKLFNHLCSHLLEGNDDDKAAYSFPIIALAARYSEDQEKVVARTLKTPSTSNQEQLFNQDCLTCLDALNAYIKHGVLDVDLKKHLEQLAGLLEKVSDRIVLKRVYNEILIMAKNLRVNDDLNAYKYHSLFLRCLRPAAKSFPQDTLLKCYRHYLDKKNLLGIEAIFSELPVSLQTEISEKARKEVVRVIKMLLRPDLSETLEINEEDNNLRMYSFELVTTQDWLRIIDDLAPFCEGFYLEQGSDWGAESPYRYIPPRHMTQLIQASQDPRLINGLAGHIEYLLHAWLYGDADGEEVEMNIITPHECMTLLIQALPKINHDRLKNLIIDIFVDLLKHPDLMMKKAAYEGLLSIREFTKIPKEKLPPLETLMVSFVEDTLELGAKYCAPTVRMS